MNRRRNALSGRWPLALVASAVFFTSLFTAVNNAASHQRDARAGSPEQQDVARELTKDLVDLDIQYQQADQAGRPWLVENLRDIASRRQQVLAALMEDNPGEVLRVAVPGSFRQSLPAEIQTYVEQHVTVQGLLGVSHKCWEMGSEVKYFLKTVDGQLSLHFAAKSMFPASGEVRVRGVRVGQAVAVVAGGITGSAGFETLAALPNTFGEQKVLVILVNFQNNQTQPYTVDYARSVVFGTTSDFYRENSYGQTWLTGAVYGWYTIPLDSTNCDLNKIASYAEAAATAAGADVSSYHRRIYAFPSNSCGFWGYTTATNTLGQVWINGSLQLRVVAHELGHTFGLFHSNALDCGSSVIGTNCSIIDYGDTLDVMGGAQTYHFNAFQKERLGWLNYGVSPPITTVQTDGTYTIDPFETSSGNPKALKLLKSVDPTTGDKTWYYVECRRSVGFDGSLSGNSNVMNGVVVHTGLESSYFAAYLPSYMLDMTPSTSSWFDPALAVGQSFSDPGAGVTITPLSAGSTGASVRVSLGSTACVRANPSASLSPSQSQWVQAGTTVTYTVTVTNNDNPGCTAPSFNLQASVPSGWTAALSSPTLTITPGGTASTTVQITSPASATSGFYTIGVTATNAADPSYSASAPATYVVASALSVTVTTDKSSYTRGESVFTTASVSGGSPVAGANVTFTIVKSNGATVTLSATTDTTGSARVKYRLKGKDPVGTYQDKSIASVSGVSAQASTSFTVR